jgi:spermidine synthase
MGWYFGFFFLSGFCSILYELVWLRLTMAQYGMTTALVSITLSMFMLGMGVGSWAAGVLVRRKGERIRVPLRLYALAEFLIGCSSLIVPAELLLGHGILESWTGNATMSSASYYIVSGVFVAITLLPWCVCMGATYPLAMAAIRNDGRIESSRSFSYLYLSNVIGALAGATVPLILIELYGFHGTLGIGSALNAIIALSAVALSLSKSERSSAANAPAVVTNGPGVSTPGKGVLVLLFLTGLSTMGMEVIWIRLFTAYIGPLVYSFALILASYLLATFLGSMLYRSASRQGDPENHLSWVLLALVGLLPLFTADPRFPIPPAERVALGIAPFAILIGFLTPMLVDRWSSGDPDRAGRAYAVNVAGCILGPLLSGFLLLPFMGERMSMLLYAVPWMAMAFIAPAKQPLRIGQRVTAYAIILASLGVFVITKSFETTFTPREVLRDSTATVVAFGTGLDKHLATNGVAMTRLTPITKMMAHFTLASLDRPPQKALIICFGMGTTYRSAMSWGIPTTAVELVPSVPRLFSFFHSDAERLLLSPKSNVVIDDGRRYMERSKEKFDAIIIDPPPPVDAAVSSLLYSKEFYAVAKQRLEPDGILEQFLPTGDDAIESSVTKALSESFAFVRIYGSVEGFGWHFFASMKPIPERTAAEMVAQMPAGAVADMMEWGPAANPEQQFQRMLSRAVPIQEMIAKSPASPPISDDRPINEYFFVRGYEAAHRKPAAN